MEIHSDGGHLGPPDVTPSTGTDSGDPHPHSHTKKFHTGAQAQGLNPALEPGAEPCKNFLEGPDPKKTSDITPQDGKVLSPETLKISEIGPVFPPEKKSILHGSSSTTTTPGAPVESTSLKNTTEEDRSPKKILPPKFLPPSGQKSTRGQ